MRGAPKGPYRDGEVEPGAPSRRLTPAFGFGAPDSDVPSQGANEDFLFHLYRGSELLQDNRAHEAKEELERALHLQPHDTKGQDLLAVVYFRLGLYPRAITIYEELRRTSPRDPSLLLNLALCYLKTGQPALARRDLEQLLVLNPSHSRGWGYLGLACERLGDLREAQRAFEQGGHAQMARRMAERRSSMSPPPELPAESVPSREVREVVAAAYEELDAGELSFALADPVSSGTEHEVMGDSWRPVELGSPLGKDTGGSNAPGDTKKPDTKDGPPPPRVTGLPQVRHPSMGRRPTLIVGVPPAADPAEIEALSRLPSPRPPTFTLDEPGAPSFHGRHVVRVPAVRHGEGSAEDDTTNGEEPRSKHTLPPPAVLGPLPSVDQPLPSVSPQAASKLTRDSIVAFPATGSVVIHPSGLALVKTSAGAGFSARLESMRASSNGLTMKMLERQMKGKSTGESFGGVGSPIVQVSGDGQLVLTPRAGRKISSFLLEDDMCFVREEVLLGFDGEVAFENGRLAAGDGELVPIVQLRGRGPVLLEAIGEILTLEVQANRGMGVRREAILGWFGRLVPRAVPIQEAPCGLRGLVSFAGEGRVLVASA
ncbi:MAG: tetratricopeptide repeat protein [Deltaproteobacteria bacterium]|nr:tetratricopeptide repeat protein [Deltaproteobacteria bacterium]